MATDEERRRVAERMRASAGKYDFCASNIALDMGIVGSGCSEGYYARHRLAWLRLADLIDPGEDVSVSAYDLLPEEERDAIAWVRERGGLDDVKKLLDWVVGHCSTRQQLDFDFWLSGRVMYELGYEEDMADRDEVESRLLARLMPEGYEWPRYEDRKPVRIGDVVSDVEVRSVVFREDGIIISDCTSVPGWGAWRSYKEPIKRPDSWEQLEEDADKEACEYFAHMPCCCETSEMLDETVGKCNAAKARDLVRRAKTLAERGQ